jgi:hypothetical protein
VKPWSQIIRECEARLSFFKKALDLQADSDFGIAHLRKIYQEYIPVIQ